MPVSTMAKQAVATTKGQEDSAFAELIKEGGREDIRRQPDWQKSAKDIRRQPKKIRIIRQIKDWRLKIIDEKLKIKDYSPD